MDIIQMAKDLGRAIQNDERYIRFRAAKEANDGDEALQQMIGEFNLKRISVNTEAGKAEKNQEKLDKLNEELRAQYDAIMGNEHMSAYNDAKQEMDGILQNINAIITVSANGGDPDTAENSCASGCEGCSGCH